VIRAGLRLRKSYVSLLEAVAVAIARQYRRCVAGVPEEIQLRQIAHFSEADSAYGHGVAARLGLVPKLQAAE
jgi:hypothetical protein